MIEERRDKPAKVPAAFKKRAPSTPEQRDAWWRYIREDGYTGPQGLCNILADADRTAATDAVLAAIRGRVLRGEPLTLETLDALQVLLNETTKPK